MPKEFRKQHILKIHEFSEIPYLNGGLFREVIEHESQYSIIIKFLEVNISYYYIIFRNLN
jgi:hypothetical protein